MIPSVWLTCTGPSAAANPDNPPLTERERQLLERIDRLEQRLAALEAKEAKAATPIVTANQPAAAPPEGASQTVATSRHSRESGNPLALPACRHDSARAGLT